MNKRVFEEYDDDRKQLARHLHSTAAQSLAALHINLSLIPAEQLPPRAAKALADCEELAQSCSKELKSVMQRLHPPLLDEAGLEAALEALAQERGLKAMRVVSEDSREISTRLALHAFRIVEELAARNTQVTVRCLPDRVMITVGGGDEIRASTRERIASLGGELSNFVMPYQTVVVTLFPTSEES